MMAKKAIKVIRYIFADDENLSLENRLVVFGLVIAASIGILGSIINSFCTSSIIAILVPLSVLPFIFIIYYLARVKRIYKTIVTPLALIGLTGISVVWIYNGGINGSNIMVAFLVLVVGLIIVPEKTKKYIIAFFIFVNSLILLIQLYRPDIIVAFPTEKDRWIDNIIAMIYSSFFIYLTISFFHKSYNVERKKAEANERKYQSLTENSQDYISRFDRQHKLVYVNKAKTEILGVSASQIIGKTQSELGFLNTLQNEKWEAVIENVFISKQPITEQFILKNTKGVIHVDSKFFPEFGTNNEIVSVLSVSRDITYLKESEIKLSQLNADKDKFISILAHDLKSPFNSILGFLSLLSKNTRKYDIDKIEKQINQIYGSAQKTYNLLEELLLWASSQSGKLNFEPQCVNLSEICLGVISEMEQIAASKQISIRIHISNELQVFADIVMFKTILRNLISNAIKFTNLNGDISINAKKNHGIVTISVSDNGIGIAPEKLNGLFDISEIKSTVGTANESGTGLGLILCKDFVEKHNGKIWVESEYGKGSEFKFNLYHYSE